MNKIFLSVISSIKNYKNNNNFFFIDSLFFNKIIYFFFKFFEIDLKFLIKYNNRKKKNLVFNENKNFFFYLNDFLDNYKKNEKFLFLNIKKNFYFILFFLYLYIYFFFFYKIFIFNKYFIFFLSFFFFFYWLFSNFFYFNKVYNFSKYTSLNQRFWKRNLLFFWSLELFLFSIYLYFFINYSAESLHFFDSERVFKNLLCSWVVFFFNNINYSSIIIFLFIFNIFKKNNNTYFFKKILLILNIFIFYCFFFEFFQFLFICNTNICINIEFDNQNSLVNIERDFEKFRSNKNYFIYCFLLKFWHLVFAIFFWFFYLSKLFSKNISSYDFFVCNLQNFLFVYFLNYVYVLYWFKDFFRYQLDFNYFWLLHNTNIFYITFNNILLFIKI